MGKPWANDSAGSAKTLAASTMRLAKRWGTKRESRWVFMVASFRSGEEEKSQHHVHRQEAHDDPEELTLVDAVLGPADVGRADGPDAYSSSTANTTPTRAVAITEGVMPLLAWKAVSWALFMAVPAFASAAVSWGSAGLQAVLARQLCRISGLGAGRREKSCNPARTRSRSARRRG